MTKVSNKINVVSTLIDAVKYENSVLFVYFKQGQVYAYTGVPQAVFDNFVSAHSKGKFFRQNILGRYLYTRAV